jgi:hypothetical protein
MKIFKLQPLLKEGIVSDNFLLELLFCNQKRELSGYWLVNLKYELIEVLISFLKEWKKAVENLSDYEKVFLSIGLWDEAVEGFYLILLDDGIIEIQYGSILNWCGFTITPTLLNIDENLFYKDFEIKTTRLFFIQEIQDNINYLSNVSK